MSRILIGVLAFLFAASLAAAHALQPGYLDLQALGGDTWRVYWKVPAVGPGPMPIEAVLPETCAPRRPDSIAPEAGAYVAQWIAACPGGLLGGEIRISGLEATSTDVLVRYETDPGEVETQRLTREIPAFEIPEPQGAAGVFLTYMRLGLEHILGGLDHLLFVFALMLLVSGRSRLIGAITAFTLGHSLSLAAATLGWVAIPAPPVEAVIALSIMFLAAELARSLGGEPGLMQRAPWIVACGFGLLHGLGFARALLDLGLPGGAVPMALVSFNIGVEAGQLLFIALVLAAAGFVRAALPALRRRLSRSATPSMRVASYAIGAVSAYWFAVRIAAF